MLREILELLTAAGLVALVAVPVGVIAFWVARRFAFPLLPAWRHRWCQWRVIDVLLLFGMYVMLPTLAGEMLERVGIYRAAFGDDALLDPTSVGAIVGGPGTSLAEAWRYDRIARRTTLAGAIAMPVFASGSSCFGDSATPNAHRLRVESPPTLPSVSASGSLSPH